MQSAPIRFLNAALWPLTIWPSLTHFEEHAADDYVERTSPIIATAIAFWISAAALIALTWIAAGRAVTIGDGAHTWAVRATPVWTGAIVDVLWLFTPAIYAIGFWLFTARDEAFPR